MPILAVGVVNRHGRVLVSRQPGDITRSRVEGLLSSFPRLLQSTKNRQIATYIDGGEVRYVFMPFMNEFFLVLLTEKEDSNIVEDLSTLHLVGRVLSEHMPQTGYDYLDLDFDMLWGGALWGDEEGNFDETVEHGKGAAGEGDTSKLEESIENTGIQILFAIDEIITNGKREETSLENIMTYLEMYSREEELFLESKRQREAQAKKVTDENAKKIAEMKRNAAKGGRTGMDANYGGFGNDTPMSQFPTASSYTNTNNNNLNMPSSAPTNSVQQTTTIAKTGMSLSGAGGNKTGLKLGGNTDLLSKIQKEVGGEMPARNNNTNVMNQNNNNNAQPQQTNNNNHAQEKGIHLVQQEHLSATITEGDVTNLDIKGELTIKVNDASQSNVKINLHRNQYLTDGTFQYKCHAKMSKSLFDENFTLSMDGNKSFPVQQPVTVLRWRLGNVPSQNVSQQLLPIKFTCWPEEQQSIVVEYELNHPQNKTVQLQNMMVFIPIYENAVSEVSPSIGQHSFTQDEHQQHYVQWSIPHVSATQGATGNIEITLKAKSATPVFFPIRVQFMGAPNIGDVHAREVVSNEDGKGVEFSEQDVVMADQFEIVK
ncbi:coatomer delta subunit-like protein [Angomonas deanei]|nr:coatomer delta subunit-like protein [Angomonas deanei]|eukprot:EPY35353.1 coatomer delta subunit-like protein [Angomonas deanei]